MTAKIFISHSSKDDEVAKAICTALENRALPCWVAGRNVGPGENFQEAIVKAIRAAKVMVLVFTENANNSDEIKKELVLASQNNLVVIPVRVENVVPNEAFAYEFATRQWVDLFKDWEHEIERLSSWVAGIVSMEPKISAAMPGKPAVHSASHRPAEPAREADPPFKSAIPADPVTPLSKNPIHHFVGGLFLIVGAFAVVFCISYLVDMPAEEDARGWGGLFATSGSENGVCIMLGTPCTPSMNRLAAVILLIAFAAFTAAGLGTIRRRKWPRLLGLGLCAVGLVITAYSTFVIAVAGYDACAGYSPDDRLGCLFDPRFFMNAYHDGGFHVIFPGVFAITFAAACAAYIWLWQPRLLPNLRDARRAKVIHAFCSMTVFVIFVLFFTALTVASMYLYRGHYPDFAGNPVLWSALLLAVDGVVLAYCYVQFRKVFAAPLITGVRGTGVV
jgi:hypothetical protein